MLNYRREKALASARGLFPGAALFSLLLVIFSLTTRASTERTLTTLLSPDQAVKVVLTLNEQGKLHYQLSYNDQKVLKPSPLGIRLNNTDLSDKLKLTNVGMLTRVADSYQMQIGKQSQIDYQANEQRVALSNPDGHKLVVVLRVSDDGLAFRYEFPGKSEDIRIVMAEQSGFHFYPGSRAWLQPKAEVKSGWKQTNPSYEEHYYQGVPVSTAAPGKAGWVYPALFEYKGHWLLLSETGMDGNYGGTNLAAESSDGLYQVRMPQIGEVTTNGARLPQARLPFVSPWRLVVVGSLADIYTSTLGTDLALPADYPAQDFVQPGIAAWSWGLLKDDATIAPVQKDFIDFAARMSWPYVLVDADWDWKIGYEKMAELADYARNKDVELLVWFNSSGAWNETEYTPKSALLTRADRRKAFARLQKMGIRGIKVDFFPGDGQSVIQYYMNILKDAADYELLVNFHGATLPRGLQRTYPNFMTSEAVKGFEMITFSQESADLEASHAATLAFTRNLFDPMDFTPMVLGDIPDIQRKTTLGFQLALPTIFTSGIQHLVTTPQQMETVPDFVQDYLRELPVAWDESRLLDGYPGKLVVVARRSGSNWYIAAINGESKTKSVSLDLSFLQGLKGHMILDDPAARGFIQTDIRPGAQTFTLPASAGFVLRFQP